VLALHALRARLEDARAHVATFAAAYAAGDLPAARQHVRALRTALRAMLGGLTELMDDCLLPGPPMAGRAAVAGAPNPRGPLDDLHAGEHATRP
jgi:hypothetical protein